jgi:SpoIID/LytB domain protein
MSQHGAQGAARRGLTYRQILAFYYPGTRRSTVSTGLRVLLTADTTPDLQVRPRAGLTLRDRGDDATYRLPRLGGVTRWRVAVRGGRNVVEYDRGGWHRWRPGGRAALVGGAAFYAPGPVTLVTPSGDRAYRGRLRAVAPTPGSADRDTVNVVPLESYVKGVIPAEMPASWHPQAVRAQAVAARTYAVWNRDQNPSRYYQICDTTACQVYGGVAAEHPLASAAVDATAGEVRTWRGAAAFTQFSASSGGWTAAGSAPYLPARRDPYDDWPGNTVHDWTVRVRASTLERAYPAIGTLRRIRVTSRDGHGEWGGRVLRAVLVGGKARRVVTGDAVRSAAGLRSTWFRVG